MTLSDLAGKRVGILGFGREGKAVLSAVRTAGINCDITVLDSNPDTKADGVAVIAGPAYLDSLDDFDVLVKSPGIPPHEKLERAKSRMTTGTQIFFDTVRPTGARIIGITGSKGKSTTTSLIHALLKAAGKDARLVGNIGEPALLHLDNVTGSTIFIHELSSYQLMDLNVSPHIAVVTAFFPEHLDYHGSLEAYLYAKKHITRFQTAGDAVFFCANSPGAAEIAKEGNGRKIPYNEDDSPVTLEQTNLIGLHNLGNIAGACAVAAFLGVDERTCVAVLKEFHGLPHRLQKLGTHHGIEWVDDAISTTPESTIAALLALENKVTTIILGGQDRGYDFTMLGKVIAQSAVENVILFPGSGPRIREALTQAGAKAQIIDAADMPSAVASAKAHTRPGTICLLSTASPSYGMFKNFEDKGDQFQKEVTR